MTPSRDSLQPEQSAYTVCHDLCDMQSHGLMHKRSLWSPSSWGGAPATAWRSRSSVDTAKAKRLYIVLEQNLLVSTAPSVFIGEISDHAQAGEDTQSKSHQSP